LESLTILSLSLRLKNGGGVMTKKNENPKKDLVTFRPRQKTFELNGKTFILPDYVGRNAIRYVFDTDKKVMLKVCLDCEKHSVILQLDEENGLFSDIHDEADVHFQGKSGFKTRCMSCDQVFEMNREKKLRDIWYEVFRKEGLFEDIEATNITLGSLTKENREFINDISMKFRMEDIEFLNYVLDVYKRNNKYVPVQFEEIIK